MTDKIQQTADLLKKANGIAILTGAGVSKESGVPTFRDAMDGLWAKYDPQELATPDAFVKNPKLVWDWYEYRRSLVRGAKPNPGHYALAKLEEKLPTVTTITQNVDDLHEQAGSKSVIHLHGNIAETKCFYHCQGQPTIVDLGQIEYAVEETPPLCPHCGRWLRPNVVWFGEMLPQDAIAGAFAIVNQVDVILVVGTSGMVTPAAALPGMGKQAGATIIEVNPMDSGITPIADIKLDGPSGEILPQVIKAMGYA